MTTETSQAPRSSKRSRKIAMTTAMCGASVSLVACDGQQGGHSAQWQNPPAQVEQGQEVKAFAYPTLQACFDANDMSDDQCREANDAAIKDNETAAPRYAERETCEDV